MAEFQSSVYQQAIYTFIQTGEGSAIVDAKAGSGKTTTIVNALKLIPSFQQVIMLAFNKSIAMELEKRVPSNVKAATFNSVGHRAWIAYAGRICKLDAHKNRAMLDMIVDAQLGDADRPLIKAYGQDICKLVALCKHNGVAPAGGLKLDTDDVLDELIEHNGLDIEDQDRGFVIHMAREVLRLGIRHAKQVIDFDDQLYMAVIEGLSVVKYHFVFVDEAQDLSPIQHAFLAKMLRPGGRLIAVGDPHQAIYGFRGADSDSMSRLAERFNCRKLPLSISYRCPQNVVMYAQQVVPDIQASPTAAEGQVLCWPSYRGSDFLPTDLVVCRNTRPLIEFAYTMIRASVPVRVLGRDIGTGLVALINRVDRRKSDRDIPGLLERLEKWRAREVERALAIGNEERASTAEDKVATIKVFVEMNDHDWVDQLTRSIEQMFNDQSGRPMLTLSTVHKAKGLEAPRVFVLEPELMPSPYARREWQIKQERNLMYVAWTRAQQTLVFIRQSGIAQTVQQATAQRAAGGA